MWQDFSQFLKQPIEEGLGRSKNDKDETQQESEDKWELDSHVESNDSGIWGGELFLEVKHKIIGETIANNKIALITINDIAW